MIFGAYNREVGNPQRFRGKSIRKLGLPSRHKPISARAKDGCLNPPNSALERELRDVSARKKANERAIVYPVSHPICSLRYNIIPYPTSMGCLRH